MLAVIAIVLAPFAVFSQPQLSAEGVRDLSAYLQESVARTHIPGVVAMVANRDEVLYSGAFGKQNVAQNIPMTMDTIFRIASMTKPVTSAAVVMLMEEGKIALDDPIGRYLPEFAGMEVIENFDFDDNSYTTRPAAS